jgi:hypothetical protein
MTHMIDSPQTSFADEKAEDRSAFYTKALDIEDFLLDHLFP